MPFKRKLRIELNCSRSPPGDPDFDLLRISAGSAFGLPSPGHTTLTQRPTGWAVDSFFDITYRIDFVGRTGGRVGGMSLHVGACSVSDGVPVGATLARSIETAQATQPGEIVMTGMLRDILAGAEVAVAVHSVAPGDGDAPPSAIWALVD